MTKVLVVDDEQGIRDLLVESLIDAGYDVARRRMATRPSSWLE